MQEASWNRIVYLHVLEGCQVVLGTRARRSIPGTKTSVMLCSDSSLPRFQWVHTTGRRSKLRSGSRPDSFPEWERICHLFCQSTAERLWTEPLNHWIEMSCSSVGGPKVQAITYWKLVMLWYCVTLLNGLNTALIHFPPNIADATHELDKAKKNECISNIFTMLTTALYWGISLKHHFIISMFCWRVRVHRCSWPSSLCSSHWSL